jgi:hypothetical protein
MNNIHVNQFPPHSNTRTKPCKEANVTRLAIAPGIVAITKSKISLPSHHRSAIETPRYGLGRHMCKNAFNGIKPTQKPASIPSIPPPRPHSSPSPSRRPNVDHAQLRRQRIIMHTRGSITLWARHLHFRRSDLIVAATSIAVRGDLVFVKRRPDRRRRVW